MHLIAYVYGFIDLYSYDLLFIESVIILTNRLITTNPVECPLIIMIFSQTELILGIFDVPTLCLV